MIQGTITHIWVHVIFVFLFCVMHEHQSVDISCTRSGSTFGEQPATQAHLVWDHPLCCEHLCLLPGVGETIQQPALGHAVRLAQAAQQHRKEVPARVQFAGGVGMRCVGGRRSGMHVPGRGEAGAEMLATITNATACIPSASEARMLFHCSGARVSVEMVVGVQSLGRTWIGCKTYNLCDPVKKLPVLEQRLS